MCAAVADRRPQRPPTRGRPDRQLRRPAVTDRPAVRLRCRPWATDGRLSTRCGPRALVPLPPQPDGVPWPTDEWPRAEPPAEVAPALTALLDDVTTDAERYGTTFAVAVVHRGRLLAERYGGELEHWDRPERAGRAHHPAAVVVDGQVDAARRGRHARRPRAGWRSTRPHPCPSGREAATPGRRSRSTTCWPCGTGWRSARCTTTPACPTSSRCCSAPGRPTWPTSRPTARWPTRPTRCSTTRRARRTSSPASSPARSAPASRTSGSCSERLFDLLGMSSAQPRFDDAGTFVGSSYVYATALDFLRFGLLYLRGGVWDGEQVLPEGWVDHGRRIRSYDARRGPLVRRPLVERRRRPRARSGPAATRASR